MDKEEYRVKLDEINRIAEAGDFHRAAVAADEIDWKHVKSVRTLCMIGEIYEADKRYDDAIRVLKFAYRRASISKTVLYRLCLLSVRTGDLSAAKKYCAEFEEISPHDSSKYILRYRIMKAENASIADRIALLSEYKEKEYTERWSYELARLYKKNGENNKCIAECDDMILWFSEGKYVYKAMELKQTITPLTPEQQKKYDARFELKPIAIPEPAAEETASAEPEDTVPDLEKPDIAIEDIVIPDVPVGPAPVPGMSDEELARQAELRKEFSEENRENMTDRLVGGIRAVLSGLGVSAEEETAGEKEAEEPEEADLYKEEAIPFEVKTLEPEIPGSESAAAPEEEHQMTLEDFNRAQPNEELDLEQLLAETKNEFAEEVASGAFERTDLPKDDGLPVVADVEDVIKEAEEAEAAAKEKAEEPAVEEAAVEEIAVEEVAVEETAVEEEAVEEAAVEEPAVEEAVVEEVATEEAAVEEAAVEDAVEAAAEAEPETPAIDPLYDKETDESLGLTREFNFQEELKKAMMGGESLTEAAKKVSRMAEDQEVPQADPLPVPEELMETVEESAKEAAAAVTGEIPKDAAEAVAEEVPQEVAETVAEEAPKEVAEAAADAPTLAIAATAAAATIPLAAAEVSTKEAAASVTAEIPKESELPKELFATEEELVVPEENLEAIVAAVPEEDSADSANAASQSIIDDIMKQPEILHRIPVEPRSFDETEKKIFSYFAPIPGLSEQVTEAMADVYNNSGDKTSKSGNILLIGRPGSGKTKLADSLIRSICRNMNIKAARTAYIVASDFNEKNAAEVVAKLSGGFLVIEAAGELSDRSVEELLHAMEFRTDSLVVILEDEKADLTTLLNRHPEIQEKFTSRITIPVFTNDELVTFAKTYTKERGYKMDELAVLALYTMIGTNQKDAEPVTVGRVKDMVDGAITKAESGTRKIGRRFSKKATYEDGRAMLFEKDFDF